MQIEITRTPRVDGDESWRVCLFPDGESVLPIVFQLQGEYGDMIVGDNLPDLLVQMAIVIRQNPDLLQE